MIEEKPNTPIPTQEKAKDDLKRKILGYVDQMMNGCSNNFCLNDHCVKNPDFEPISKKDAAAASIKLI